MPPGISHGFGGPEQECSKCHTLNTTEATELLKHLEPNINIIEIRTAPVKGFWEIAVESAGRKGLVYVDFGKKHFLFGQIVLAKGQRNLTQERFDELNKIDVSQIPLDNAVVMGDKNAKKRVIVFDDPD